MKPRTQPRRVLRRPHPLLLAGLFLALSVAWRIGVEIVAGVLVVASLVVRGVPLSTLRADGLQDAIPPSLMAAASILQVAGLGVLAFGLARMAYIPRDRAFALRRVPPALWLPAILGGLTVGFFPGWLAWHLARWFPSLDHGVLETVTDALLDSDPLSKGSMLIAVCVFAPIFEELVFRGFLWHTLETALPRWSAWLITSVLFAAYHIDPIQGTAVLYTGLFLGVLRWASGSIVPSILAHFLNNSLAAIATFSQLPSTPEAPPPTWSALLSIASIAAMSAWAARAARNRRATPTTLHEEVIM